MLIDRFSLLSMPVEKVFSYLQLKSILTEYINWKEFSEDIQIFSVSFCYMISHPKTLWLKAVAIYLAHDSMG
jgi:hypothetical protein